MDQDPRILQLFNHKISRQMQSPHIALGNKKVYSVNFHNYDLIYQILTQNQKHSTHTTLKIYDYTLGLNQPGATFTVNDHINRIGNNPFIGKQNFFNIDFINVEKLYIQHHNGIITNSCGNNIDTTHPYPSSYLANVAMLGHVLNYKIEGYLIHV